MKAKEMILASLAALLAGCTCTTIEDQYSVADPGKSGALRYKKVADLDSRVNYSADVIPVVLRKKDGPEKKDALGGLHGIVWLCTIGLFPAWDTYERTWEVEVKTPIGVKVGECTRTRREYLGWIPYMLPCTASDSEMKFDPSGELARRVVAQFKSEWTPEKVSALNTAEGNRIAVQRKRADELLTVKDWKSVIALCANEKDGRFADEYRRKVKEAETYALENMNKLLSALLAKHEYDQAEKVLFTEYANWEQVDGYDAKAWKALDATILKQKEEFRIVQEKKVREAAREKAKKEIEQLLNAGKYDEAVAACEKEAEQAEGARRGDKLFWLNCKMTVARKGAEAKIAAIRKELEARVQPKAKERIAQTLAFAKKSAEEGNINFFGFFVGMSQYDAFALARYYGLDEDQYSIVADEQGTVNVIWISLKGIRRLVKKGNTFQELYRVVEPLVGDMSFDTDSAFNEAFDSSLAAVFSLGQKRPSVPKAKYVRETIDGVIARMFDGEQGGLSISQKNPKVREPIATEAAKLEYEAHQEIVKTRQSVSDLQEAEVDRLPAMEILNNMVSIPGKNFKMGKYEVTQRQWMAVMGNNPSRFKGKKRPVECVSWNDCKEFLEKLNALPDVKCSGLTFRLPTEMEWDYACRAGSTSYYCKLADGTEITRSTLGEVAWYDDNSSRQTHPVGQKEPNAFGLYDMHGNVWEWCEGRSQDGYSRRVGRGGSWDGDSWDCQASYRGNDVPGLLNGLGFRLAASQDENR